MQVVPSKEKSVIHDKQVVVVLVQVLHGDEHMHVVPLRTLPVTHVRQVVGDVEHVSQGELQV